MFTNTSQYAHNVDFVMTLIVGISVFLLLGITLTMIYFIIRYNHKKNPVAKQIKNNVLLEIVWIVVPIFIVMVMFYYGYIVFREGRIIPKDAMEIKVEASMWKWKFTYSNGKVTDTLFVPQNQDILFKITSLDVVHSFYLPAFRIKEDAVSYKPNRMLLKPEIVGAYDIACAEYCGLNHSLMYSKMYVVPKSDFDKWYSGQLTNNNLREIVGEIKPSKTSESENLSILDSKRCKLCHSVDGSKSIGPSFAELSKKTASVLVNGKELKVKIDSSYLFESIKYPQNKITMGYDKVPMPDQMSILNDDDVNALVKILLEKFVNKK